MSAVSTVLSHFNFLDYMAIGLISCAMFLGGIKGFCQQIVSWFFWLVAGYIGYYHAVSLSNVWFVSVASAQVVRIGLVLLSLLLVAILCSFVLNKIMQRLLQLTGMVVFDRFLGVYLGMVQAVVMLAFLITGFSATSVRHEHWWQESRVVTMTAALMPVYASDAGRLVDQLFAHMHKLMAHNVTSQLNWGSDNEQSVP
jgi:uncharacterized membrane protein required for colicin V production